jgi:hypothetical protein
LIILIIYLEVEEKNASNCLPSKLSATPRLKIFSSTPRYALGQCVCPGSLFAFTFN